MAITLHDKYSKQIQTAFVKASLIAGALSNEYDFAGVKTVKIVTPQTVPMVDYTRTGTNRYGTPTEMEDVVQELTLTQDKSFALTIDKGNNADQNGVKAAGKMLALQLAERAVPEMDKYVFAKLAELAGTKNEAAGAITKSNVVERIATAGEALDNAEVPDSGRTLFVSASTLKFLKIADEWISVDSLGEKALAKGVVGEYGGAKVVKVPSSRMPAGCNFILLHRSAACAPVKLNDTKLHVDPPGISGNLLEGRQYYDCFVFKAKEKGVYADFT